MGKSLVARFLWPTVYNHNYKIITKKFKVYSEKHCSHSTKKTKRHEKKEKTDRSSIWI